MNTFPFPLFIVETQAEFITINTNQGGELGEIQIVLASCVKGDEIFILWDLTKSQANALIEALQEAKEALE